MPIRCTTHIFPPLSLLLFWLSPMLIFAQSDSLKLNAKFRFHDGIYWSAQALKNNKPNLVSADLTKNAIVTDNVIQTTADPKNTALKTAWCIVKNGVPYLQYRADTANTDVQTFYKLQLQGKICYFGYSRNEMKRIPMNVFDPQTHQLIYTSFIQNSEKTTYRFIARLSDGNIIPLNRKNLAEWTIDDKKLTTSILDLQDDDELAARLFKSVLVYNDRNFVWIKK